MKTRATASAIASCDSDAATCKRRRNLTCVLLVPSSAIAVPCPSNLSVIRNTNNMSYLRPESGRAPRLDAQKNGSFSSELIEKSSSLSDVPKNIQHYLIPA
jgi:hypothetical protein